MALSLLEYNGGAHSCRTQGQFFWTQLFRGAFLGNFLAFGMNLWNSAKAKPIRFCWISFPATGKASWWILLSPVCMREILQQRRRCMDVNRILHARCCGFRTPSALCEAWNVVIGGLQRRDRGENILLIKQNDSQEAVQPWYPCTFGWPWPPDFGLVASTIIHTLPMPQQQRIFKCRSWQG